MKRMATIAACLLLAPVLCHAYDVEVIQNPGDPANRVNLAILGDGYRMEDQDQLTNDVNSFIEELWAETPYGEYKDFLNINLVHVISNENGADRGTYGEERDTALGAHFFCADIERLLCIDNAAVIDVVMDHVPESDFTIVIVNDPKYGGGGGVILAISTNPQSGDIVEHELGHGLANLADEYEEPYPGFPECGGDCPEPNVTVNTVYDDIKWNAWIDEDTPLPTPDTSVNNDVIGAFEGARFQSTGVFRPKRDCKMRALGIPFCEVCSEALIFSIYNFVEPIDSMDPEDEELALSGDENVVLEVFYPTPAPDTMRFTWRIDGTVSPESKSAFTVAAGSLGDGVHTISVTVDDDTPLVRSAPGTMLTSSRQWTIDVSDAGPGGDTDTDTDADAGSHTDTDTDTDTDVDAGSEPDSNDSDCGCRVIGRGASAFLRLVDLYRYL
ncbi:MAG: hypothetical protein GY854_14665 [Deltaproteobacteria bacterium]|nr:hypothetical protein [Deltaproteobacteria bacterium]